MFLLLLTAVLTAAAVLPLPGSDGRILHLPSICIFYDTTGLPCPGCGLTRSFVCLAHGRLAEAFRWHPLGPLVFLVVAGLWAECASRVFRRQPLISVAPRLRAPLSVAAAVIFLMVGIGRDVLIVVTHGRF
jgi:hypothetical protein